MGDEADGNAGAEHDERSETEFDDVEVGEPTPEHWHDSLASRFGYPRLSCQIEVDRDLHIEIPAKLVWGSQRVGNRRDGE